MSRYLFLLSFAVLSCSREYLPIPFANGNYQIVGSESMLVKKNNTLTEFIGSGESWIKSRIVLANDSSYILKVIRLENVEWGCIKKGDSIKTTIEHGIEETAYICESNHYKCGNYKFILVKVSE